MRKLMDSPVIFDGRNLTTRNRCVKKASRTTPWAAKRLLRGRRKRLKLWQLLAIGLLLSSGVVMRHASPADQPTEDQADECRGDG